MPLQIVPRTLWAPNNIPDKTNKFISKPASWVFFINSHSSNCDSQDTCLDVISRLYHLQQVSRQRFDIRYNFLIADDGTVYEGLGWNPQPFMPKLFEEYRRFSYLFAFIGTYTEENLPEAMAQAAVNLVARGIEEEQIAKDFRYRSVIDSDYNFFKQLNIE